MLKFLAIIFFILPVISANGEVCYTNHLSTQPADSIDIKRHALIVKAQSSYNAREFESAIRYAEQGLLKLDSVREVDLAVYTCNLLGSAYTKIRSFDKALSRLNTALRLSQRLHKDHYLIGDCHFHLGVYHDVMGNRDETVRHHTISHERRMALFGPDHLKVAESYNGLGEVYAFIFFDYRKAIVFYEKSLRIREKHLAPDAHELYAGYYNLSQSYRMLEDGDKALSYAFKALTVVNAKRQYVSLLEKCYMLLGNIHAGRLEYGPALDYFKKGMQQSVSFAGPDNYNLILSYTSLGLAYGEMGQLQMAIKSFKKSLNIYSHHKATNSGLLASNFLHLGRMFQKTGEYDSAKYYLKRNLDVRLAGSGPTNKRTSDAYSYLAKFYQQFGEMDTAAFYIQKALIAGVGNFDDSNIDANPILDKTIRSYELFELFGDKGSILLDYYNKDGDVNLLSSAMASFKISDALMELNRRAYHQERAKLFFADHYHHIYEGALQATYLLFNKTQDPGHFANALTFMEKSKAILLAESLNKVEIFTSAGLPDSLR
ncbi:MAG: tetratricopeptide repeat protein, partial [Cyclobacteriaceae bacterium]